MKFRCWLKDRHNEKDGHESVALTAQDAASAACEEWNSLGRWGERRAPWEIEVYVRDLETRELFLVAVEPLYGVSFYGGRPKPAAEPG